MPFRIYRCTDCDEIVVISPRVPPRGGSVIHRGKAGEEHRSIEIFVTEDRPDFRKSTDQILEWARGQITSGKARKEEVS